MSEREPCPAWAVERLIEQAAEIARLQVMVQIGGTHTGMLSAALSRQFRQSFPIERVAAWPEMIAAAVRRQQEEQPRQDAEQLRQTEEDTNEIRRLHDELAVVESARAEAERQTEEILATHNEARAGLTIELSGQLKKLAAAQQRITALEAELDAARVGDTNELRSLHAQVVASEGARARVEEQLEAAEESLAAGRQRVATLEQAVDALGAELNAARVEHTNEVRSQLHELAAVTTALAAVTTAKRELERRIAGALRYLRTPSFEGAVRHAIYILDGTLPPDEDVLPPPHGATDDR